MKFAPATEQALPVLLLAFLLAAAVTLLATPVVRRYARRFDVVDRPEARRVNTRPIARGGGVAIGLGFLPVSLVLLWVNAQPAWRFMRQPSEIGELQILALLGGAGAAVLIGSLDDFFQLRARWQFVGQLALASGAVALGVLVGSINDPFRGHGVIPITGVAALGLTLFWIVGMLNSINFIDGLDGLSSGIALIAALTLGGISLTQDIGQPFVAFFCFTLAGALAGFLRWNFHPASIFAGTSGTMLVGYTLAVLSILGPAKVAVALLVLGVPIIDTFWIIVRRIASGRAPFAPDRGHIHHRLLDLGLSHRNTVLLIYAVCVALALLDFGLSGTGQLYAFLGLFLISGLALVGVARIGGGANAAEDLQRDAYEREIPDGETAPPSSPQPVLPSPPAEPGTDSAPSPSTVQRPGRG